MSATSASALNHAVWRPDALGSVCFLVSSYLSWAEVCHGAARWMPKDLSWWIVAGNLAGSIAFGVSAVAARYVVSGTVRSASWTTLGTFVGGVCFLGASVLLLPERTQGRDPGRGGGRRGPAGDRRGRLTPPGHRGPARLKRWRRPADAQPTAPVGSARGRGAV